MTATTTRPAPSATPARRRRPRVVRSVGWMIVVLLAVLVTGVAAQEVLERRDAVRYPAPGTFVDVDDGRMLHARVAGRGRDGPTVVLEAGGGSFSPQWAWVQAQVAEFAPVVSYDRAGLGWSDRRDGRWDADDVSEDLAAMLDRLDLPSPYILVGHSHGASIAQMFTHRYPDKVAGMVLVDPNHEDQFDRIPSRNDLSQLRTMSVAARVGLLRVVDPFAEMGSGMPPGALAQYRAVGYGTDHNRGFLEEGETFRDVIAEQMQGSDLRFGDLPITVLHASAAEWDDAVTVEQMQRDLLDASSQAAWVEVAGADHYSIVTEQRHARTVTDAVVDMLDTTR